jgi:hypothetical protein
MITKAKRHVFSLTVFALLLAVFLPCNESLAASNSCAVAKAAVRKAVKKNPQNAPAILADAIKNNAGCECELTKAAIMALPEKDPDLVKKIVEAALAASPGESETIARCAHDAAPYAETQIDQAVASASGGGGGAGTVPVGLVSGYSGLGFSGAGAGAATTTTQ